MILATVAGLTAPFALAVAVVAAAGLDPVAAVGAACASAAAGSLRPLGGGMVVQGVWRVRLFSREWTFDADRSAGEAMAAAFLLPFVTVGGFFAALPLFAFGWTALPAALAARQELLSLATVAALVGASLLRHRPEAPLAAWREGLEAALAAGTPPEPTLVGRYVGALAALARPDGGIGHVGGIGAATPGLHEHLDAEAILRVAAQLGDETAARLHARALDYLQAQQLPSGGFSYYPGGAPRLEPTARAALALGSRLSAAELEAHRAFVRSCRIDEVRFGRSPGKAGGEEEQRWANALVGA
jgi:hypothetical protein